MASRRTQSPSIIATCKQTRFHLREDRGSGDVDIQGLNITVSSRLASEPGTLESGTAVKTKARGKSRAKGEGVEILSSADLRLKAGVHYGLVGRNGTGKSTILRAMAEKLIPGLPDSLQISFLQQTEWADNKLAGAAGLSRIDGKSPSVGSGKTVLQHVMSSDESRNEVEGKIKVLSHALEETDDQWATVQAIRKLRHDELKRQLFLAQKNASLRSGSRGMEARKALKAAEAKVAESEAELDQKKEECEHDVLQKETQAAVDLLNDLQAQFDAMRIVDIEKEARKVLLGLGFKEASLEQPFNSLSGGWRMRCAMAGVLIQHADIMILDEPTNFLDLLGVIWLENYLTKSERISNKIVILVSHDRDFLNTVCQEIVILRDQKLTYFKGNLSEYEEDVEAQKLYWGRMKEAQDKQIAHMETTIRENMKLGKKTGDDNKLRMAKSRQKKVDDRMGVQVSATGGRFKLNRDLPGYHESRRAEIEVPVDEKGVSIAIPDAPDLRFPGPLISMESILFKYKGRDALVLNGIDLVIHMGDRVGIMGLNGCGKTTLLRSLVGSTGVSKGTVSRHPRLKLGYYSQHAAEELKESVQSDPGTTALSLILREAEGELLEGGARSLLSSLGLVGRTASDVPVAQLSGGQLVRLALARILRGMPHLLILDEITTHLDFHTVVALAEALSSYNGALLLVSHDRYLIRTVVEGKRETSNEDGDGQLDVNSEEEQSRRRHVYVLKGGKLSLQENGVEQFEKSLGKRVRKLLEVG
ncbi:hypothetical protein AJ80_01793 [Polytolypa hystricis UAMH7299]|uniref:ABC transporter domain-containing protein n=1 Tax=Polytolypa hystricis (strain UAMH7299) TaxID=1447883 RepID=A0A2B7YZR1_POLH7|nr:hypothetical protein AJ80_01793 [Polytolypa hystricis UAMH7299]